MAYIRLGLIGFSQQKFDENITKVIMSKVFNIIKSQFNDVELVSGLTNMGIPKIGYELATELNWKTVGIACSQAYDYPWFGVDDIHIIGDNWGDESEYFLEHIDILLKFGGGDQSKQEYKTFKEKYPEKPAYDFRVK